ncbi:biotin carboxylase N-terminal domain-containing protein [Cupriavidus sp. KK10]
MAPTAWHPGYGFLSENTAFVQAWHALNLAFGRIVARAT